MWGFLKKQIEQKNQIFWVCPLIDESKLLDYSSAKNKFDLINKKFNNKVGIIHGSLEKDEKEKVLQRFLDKKIFYFSLDNCD